jgi:hypothetical protein
MRNTAAAVAAPVPLLMLDEVADIYRQKPATIRRKLNAGNFVAPCAEHPYRWHPDDIAADLDRRRAAGRLRSRPTTTPRPRIVRRAAASPRRKRR